MSATCQVWCHDSSASEDKVFNLSHDLTKESESYNFMSGNFSWYVTALPSLVAIVIEIVQIFSVCHLRYNSFSLSDDLAGLINWSL